MSLKAVFAAMSIKIKVLIACAAVVVIGGTAAAVGISMNKEDSYRVLKVFEMSGETTVTREGSGELAAYVGMNLESGDLISVGEGSTIRLSLDGDKYIQLDELTVLELEATGTKTDSRTLIKLKEGTILNEITNPLSENSVYEVATPKATMAVRGTSFSVTVTKDTEGRYIITENTFHGKVEAILLDESGAKTSKTAIVNPDRSITICTSPNKETGNPAEIDGTSVFVIYDTETGEMQIVPDGEDPTHDIDYELISAIVREYALRSNDTNLMTLEEKVVNSLRGNGQKTASPADTGTAETTTSAQPEPSETTVPESTVSEADDEPINSDNTENAFAAAAPIEENSPADNADTAASESTAAEESTTAASTTTAEETTAADTTTSEETTTAETTTFEETTTAETTTTEATTTAPVTTTAATTTTEVTTAPVTTTEPVTTTTAETTEPAVTTSEPEEVPESFEITFKCNGEIVKTVSAELGDSLYDIVSEVPVPEKEGKTGVWKINGLTAVTSDMTVAENITLTAVYSENTYTITFVADGADEAAPKPVTALYGDSLYDIVSACEVPAKTGYKGIWLVDGAPVSERMTVTKDVTVTAVYSIEKFTVYFIAPDADDPTTVPSPVEVDYGTELSKVVPADVPAKTGYTGVWKIDGKTAVTAGTVVEADTTVMAVYTPVKYTVTFTADGADNAADIPAAAEYDYGTLLSKIVPANVPAKTGHTGVWLIDGTTAVTDEMTLTGDITLTAVYTPIKYTVSFDASEADDGTGIPAAAKYDYGTLLSEIVPANVPAKTGHTGVWKINGTTDITAESFVDGNITVKAVYTPVKHTITFTAPDADDPTTVPAPVEAEYGSLLKDAVPANVPEKTGHTGVWKIDGTTAVTDEMTVDGDITLTAIYTINKYTVTFTAPEADDPTDVPAPVEVEYGALLKEIVTADVPIKTGHTGEWKIEGLYAIDSTASVSEDVTVTAVYDKNKYTITFTAPEADDPTAAPEPVTAEYGDDLYDIVSSTDVPKKAGNDGVWKVDGTTDITSPYPIDEDITVTAVYTERTYVNINYNFNGTTGTVQGNSGEYLKSQIIPNKIQNETYANDLMNPYAWLTYNNSWSSSGNSNADRVDSGMVVDDYVIKQDEVEVWSAKKHTISYTAGSSTGQFYLYDGESIVYIYGGFLDDILNGYTGFLDADGKEFTNTSTVSADTTITAYKYKVTLSYINGTSKDYFFGEGESFNSKYGGMPTPDARTGYEATEWKKFDDTVISPSDTIISSMTLIPNQTEKSYSVTFSISDGTPATKDISFESAILGQAPSLDDSIYNAWYIGTTKLESTTTLSDLVDSGDITGEETSITVTAGGDTSVNYTVTFEADGADDAAPSPVELAYGTKLAEYLESSVTIPKKSGSDGEWKIGGTDAISADYIVHKDITVSAVYTQRTSVNVNYNFNGTTGTVQGNKGERLEANIIPKIDTTSYANELMNPYIWMTRNSSWTAGASESDVQVTSGMEVTNYVLDQSDVSIWTENKHTVSYNVGGTTGTFYLPNGKSISQDYSVSNFLSGLLGDYGAFVDEGGNEFTESTPVTGDINITAKYTVTFNHSNGTSDTYYFDNNDTFNSKGITLPTIPAEIGYNIIGWVDSGDNTFTADTAVTSNLSLSPKKVEKTITVSCFNKDGASIGSFTANYFDKFRIAASSVYSSDGSSSYWSTNSSGSPAISPSATVGDVANGQTGVYVWLFEF